ncbi:MAG: ABC transporter permease [Planctomycetes bacterium]|nr:ABC transporter permease [Planctomycetota bacterium]MCP4771347.1 ABC transporter permease [Planctomycetota bacterium]MCP4861784.1 ABC transporter permease [Planctomycetota bacterium]
MSGVLARTVQLGVKSLLLHKLRSLLTTLGVLFGVSSVIAMLAIGEGASAEAQEQIKQLGSQNVILRSVKPPEDVNNNQTTRLIEYGLTHNDFSRVTKTYPWVENAVPVRILQQEVRYDTKAMHPRVMATESNYQQATGRMMHEGRFLTAADDFNVSNVCVLGYEVARELLPLVSPLGQRIKIGTEYFTVVGTLLPRVPIGDDVPLPGADVTGEIFIPLTTGARWFGEMQVKQRAGSREMETVELHEIIVHVDKAENVERTAAACREMLRRNHDQDDYEVVVPLELLARAEETKRIFNIVLGSIAGISLLVGGIGIMNVMLATVTERTREIGIRRALGAKQHHIVFQFLVETVVLSVGGGLAGIILGLAIPIGVEHFADMRTIVQPSGPILAFGISVSIGLLFGLYPAWRAAQMDPVEALRHE